MITSRGKINQELINKIVEYISHGNYISTSCQACGISHRTYDTWIKHGEELAEHIESGKNHIEESQLIYLQFFEAIKKAESEAEAKNVQIIQSVAPKNWQAAAWLLERKYPEKYGKREVLDINVKRGIEVSQRLATALKRSLPTSTDMPLLDTITKDKDVHTEANE